MTDQDRQLLIYVAVKQARMDSLLTAAIPIILRYCGSDREEDKALRGKAVLAFGQLTAQLYRQQRGFLKEQFPEIARLIED